MNANLGVVAFGALSRFGMLADLQRSPVMVPKSPCLTATSPSLGPAKVTGLSAAFAGSHGAGDSLAGKRKASQDGAAKKKASCQPPVSVTFDLSEIRAELRNLGGQAVTAPVFATFFAKNVGQKPQLRAWCPFRSGEEKALLMLMLSRHGFISLRAQSTLLACQTRWCITADLC